MFSTLVLTLLTLVQPARAELSPGEDENGFRIYDILEPSSGVLKPKADAGTSNVTRVANGAGRDKANGTALRGKLLVVGKQDLTVGGVTWQAGSNYWFWSKNPAYTGDDPCRDEPLARMVEPSEPASFALRVAVDGMKGASGSLASNGSLPGTSCRPQHAARGPSRVFDRHEDYSIRDELSGSNGTLYRLELVSKQARHTLGYAFHDPAAPNFGDPARFGWFLETAASPDTTRPLSRLPRPQGEASKSTYRQVVTAPRGIVELHPDDVLLFTIQTERPDKVSGVNTIDLLQR